VTKYLNDHPGGAEVLAEAAGTDASDDFDNAGHSEDAFEVMQSYCVGKLGGFKKRKEKLKPVTPVEVPKIQSGRTSTTSVARLSNLGLLSLAVATLYHLGRRQGLSMPKWMISPRWMTLGLGKVSASQNSGVSLFQGVVIGGGLCAVVVTMLAKKFSAQIGKSRSFTSYPPHMKVPKRVREETLLRRGFLDPVTYSPLPLKTKTLIAPNVYRFTFSLPKSSTLLGLPIGQHVTIKAEVAGETVARSYTPVSNNSDRGVIELVIKVYHDGKLARHLATLNPGDEVLFRGPKGAMRYHPGLCKKIGMVAGGTGITPMYQLIRAICEDERDTTEVSLIYANRTEEDILLRKELDRFARRYPKNFKVYYMLDNPPAGWASGSGFVTQDIMAERLPEPAPDSKIMLCGPPGMVAAAKKALVNLGFKQPGASTKASDEIFVF
jgi:cytochrome-b5 reductase